MKKPYIWNLQTKQQAQLEKINKYMNWVCFTWVFDEKPKWENGRSINY